MNDEQQKALADFQAIVARMSELGEAVEAVLKPTLEAVLKPTLTGHIEGLALFNNKQQKAMADFQAIVARHGHDLTPADSKDREIAELRDKYAAADLVCKQNQALARRLTREQEEDRRHQGRIDAAIMEALPHRRFPGGTRLDEMVLQCLAWLKEARPDLWRDMGGA